MSSEIMARVWQNSQAGGDKLLLLLALADGADGDGLVIVNKPLLADKCRRSVKGIERALEELERANELVRRGNLAVILAGRDRDEGETVLRRWEVGNE
ncbi:hypothetical protein BECAL_02995 [Bellilinea caldifistulae]|uniref:Uncharacterized protein n=1 Tax=Bellilinea caldifistulae TaxID=360411 RepID=A0A0P6X5A6_9CHLR|nr:hypothetical protein [Bellilinea caldifistulae]KPL74585.1 hypothetical protein AC812_12385 [Bellilinea caldifistulae]GAP11801.1 hypothetical protein BECAL_02995 [Bellilinea caldifistulae]